MYQIPIEGKQIKRNQVTGMHLMAGLLLLVMGMFTWMIPNQIKQEEFDFMNWAGLVYAFLGLLLLIVCIFFNKKIIQTKANFTLRILELITLSSILIYSLVQKWYLPAGYSAAAFSGIILAFYWEKNGRQNKIALLDDQGLHMAGLGKIGWHDINNVILRHNILTIDCKNNKLYQLTVDKNTKAIDKEKFESYCNIQIKAKKRLENADW